MKSLAILFVAATLSAQVQPAPGWCSMAHCNNQMTDFVPLTPVGLGGAVYVMNRDAARSGVATGLACVSNGTNFACAYRESPDALVYYDADGNVLWTSKDLLDDHINFSAPIIQADGSVVIADDQHVYKFNRDGTVGWSFRTPGGQPTSLVTTPNGAIFGATDVVPVNPCLQNNCQLVVVVTNPGNQYTAASVVFSGGDCPGVAATATASGGQITAVTVTTQGIACIIPPDVIITGDGSGAEASAQLAAGTPVAAYNGTTGELVGSLLLYANGTSGPFYLTANTPCVNNGSFPNRVYVSTNLSTDSSQGMLWALDIDPTNHIVPIRPAWSIPFHGPSRASPLCIGNNVYFDGEGLTPGDNVGTTIFGVQDNGASSTILFHQSLGPAAGPITSNFAMDPRTVGGFWHQVQNDPKIYHRSGVTGSLIESINIGSLMLANGAPSGSYWPSGVFTTYGTADHPYMLMAEHASTVGAYYAMVDITNATLIWALPIYPGNSPFSADSAEGAGALAIDGSGQPVVAIASRYNGAYFIASGPGTLSLSRSNLSYGNAPIGVASAAQTIAVTNTASSTLNISGVAISGDYSQTNNCGASLPPGLGCTITVTFSPPATGLRNGSITIASNAVGSPHTIALSGAGITGQPLINLSSTLLSFPAQSTGTTSPPQSVTLANSGTATLTVASIGASGDAVETSSCWGNLAPGASCLINVMFAANGAGARSGAITVSGNAPNSPQIISFAGTGTLPTAAAAGLSSTSLMFPDQLVGTASASVAVTLVNPGTATLSIASITASGDISLTSTCGASLAAGAGCLIQVTFTPGALGTRNGTVIILDNAPDSPQSIMVSGVGSGNPVPLLHQPVAPANWLPGAAGFTLTVTGAGFIPGAAVEWNGAPLVTSFVTSTKLTAAVPQSAVAAPGTAAVNVCNPGPGGTLSNSVWFPITTPSATLAFNRSDVPTGAGPQGIASADLNADGKLDLVVVNSRANTVSVLFGNGDGTFAPKADYPAGAQPVAIAVADFNGDGKPDLAVVNQDDSTVSILIGGSGLFTPATPYYTGNSPVAIAVADFNGDGKLDLAVANQADNTVSILQGNGDGTFRARVDYAAGQSPSALVVSDFNADGKLDLAVANNFISGTVSLMLGNGDSTWQPPVAYATGDSVGLVVADFNYDGKPDLAAINSVQQSLSVLLSNGDGTFQAALQQPLACGNACQLDPGPAGLAVGALNGDGSLAVVVANSIANAVSVMSGDGNGVFSGPWSLGRGPAGTDYATAPNPVALVTGDFNGDGSLDLAVAALGADTISVLLQSPTVMLSNTSLAFGNLTVGSSASQTVTLTNTGSAILRVTGIAGSGSFSQTNNCGTLAAGAACSITVTFTPARVGMLTGTVTVTDNAPGPARTISLGGTGVTTSFLMNLSSTTATGGKALLSNSVSLSGPAPAGGAKIGLSSSNPAVASLPSSVTIPQGATTSSTFNIVTTGVSAPAAITISATYQGAASRVTLTVSPATPTSLRLSAVSITSGLSTTANAVILNGQAPPVGATCALLSSNPAAATVPASVTLAAYATTSAPFTITAGFVSAPVQVVITATYGTATMTANLIVNPVGVAAVSLTPAEVVGGVPPAKSQNLVSLNAPAPPGGASVTLTSSKPAIATVPAKVVVAAGALKSPTFAITTRAVSMTTPVTISATYNGATQTATLTADPATPSSVSLAANRVTGGPSVLSNRVLLNGPALAGGLTLALSSSNPAIATVPSSVVVNAGDTYSQPFTITTSVVSSPATAIISASYLGVTKAATLTVNP